jgi:acetaldehyde dehydrogenase (acetylating)
MLVRLRTVMLEVQFDAINVNMATCTKQTVLIVNS